MRRLLKQLFSSVGARVVVLIVCATLPLAAISALLAWHAYRDTVNGGFDRSQADLFFARSLLVNEVFRVRDTLETVSGEIGAGSVKNLSSFEAHVTVGNICRLELLDEHGVLIKKFQTPAVSAPACATPDLGIEEKAWRQSSPQSRTSDAPFITVVNRRIYIRVAMETPYLSAGSQQHIGHLVGVKYFPIKAALAYSHMLRGEPATEIDDVRLLTEGSTPLSLVSAHDQPVDWSSYAKKRFELDMKRRQQLDHFKDGNLSYAFTPAFKGSSLVAVTKRRPSEAHALDLFLARVAFISFLLIIELALVALAANFFLVSPLQKLAKAVNQWRHVGKFNPTLHRTIPSEIFQMSRAFKRATRTLERHEADIKRAMREQDVLIKEIHHRVKNNLQIVASLLSLQARRINQPEARREFQEVRERVRALATLHRHLYPDGGAAILGLDAFLSELARQLYSVYAAEMMGRIELVIDLAKVTVSADQAVPIGLIVTELMTNAFAHGFPEGRSGVVRLCLTHDGERCVLTVADNGVGFNPDQPQEAGAREGIGRKLVAGFVKQLNAEIVHDAQKGSKFSIAFDVKPLKRISI